MLLAKAQQHIARQRRDFHHKAARKRVQEFDTIYHEDVRVANMIRNHHLAKSIQDAGWGAFLAILTFKAVGAGKRVVAVNPAFTASGVQGQTVVLLSPRACRRAGMPARSAGPVCPVTTIAARNIQRLGQEQSQPGDGRQAST
jgi:IS605 OrfB family transposase